MSALRHAEINGIFTRWLERYSPPNSMRDNARAQQDEVEALLRVLLKFAPGSDAGQWVREVLDQLEYQMKTRAWPTKGELGAACSNLRKVAARSATSEHDLHPVEINAARMNAGEAVGEDWLYGANAVALATSGLVSGDTMRRYRSGAYFARKAHLGEAKARSWEDAQLEIHEAAKAVWRARDEEKKLRQDGIPDKRLNPPADQAA
jgi:hypothetical protein